MSKKSTLSVHVSPEIAKLSDQELGRQLVTQFERANLGMIEYISFGALALACEARINSTRGIDTRPGGKNSKGTGLKAWLKDNAAEVPLATMYRYMDLAEIVRDEVALPQKVDLYHLLKGEKLDAREKKLRGKIEDFVGGKSQRQLLIGAGKFDAQRGGKRNAKPLTPEERHARVLESSRSTAIATFSALHELDDRWMLLDDNQVELAVENAKKFAAQGKAWLETPVPKRAAFKIEKYLKAEDEG